MRMSDPLCSDRPLDAFDPSIDAMVTRRPSRPIEDPKAHTMYGLRESDAKEIKGKHGLIDRVRRLETVSAQESLQPPRWLKSGDHCHIEQRVADKCVLPIEEGRYLLRVRI